MVKAGEAGQTRSAGEGGEGRRNMMKAKEGKLCRELSVQLVASCL